MLFVCLFVVLFPVDLFIRCCSCLLVCLFVSFFFGVVLVVCLFMCSLVHCFVWFVFGLSGYWFIRFGCLLVFRLSCVLALLLCVLAVGLFVGLFVCRFIARWFACLLVWVCWCDWLLVRLFVCFCWFVRHVYLLVFLLVDLIAHRPRDHV